VGRQQIIQDYSGREYSRKLTVFINKLDDTSDFIEPADAVTTFIRIEDEIVQYTAVSGNDLTGVTRGALGTVAVSHDDLTEISTYYRLSGGPIDLALKLMLSNPEQSNFIEDLAITAFVQVTPSLVIANGVFFPAEDLQRDTGIVVGDRITITGATEGANNFTDRLITQITQLSTGTVITVDGAGLVSEIESSALGAFGSKFNVLPEGSRVLDPRTVDVERHEFWDTLFPTSFPEYVFKIDETIDAKDFINSEIYFPAGLYPTPRDGKASINFSIPPLVDADSVELTSEVVKSPEKLVIGRSTNKNFFNAIVYKYQQDVLEDKFLAGVITQSARSTNRIKTVNRPLTIEANGLVDDAETLTIINRQTRRFLDRYQFAAETIKIDVLYKIGMPIEVGDVVIFGNSLLQVTDINEASRDFQPRLMEVLNKSMDIKTGQIQLELVDTFFSGDARYGTYSPTSFVNTGATTTRIPLKESFGTTVTTNEENFKWQQYIGETITVNNADFSIDEKTIFNGFDPTNPNVMLVDALSFAPAEDLFVNAPQYPEFDTDPQTQFIWKTVHCFCTAEVAVVSGASSTVFDVGAGDIGKFFVESLVRVHNADFTLYSSPGDDLDDAIVIDITGVSTGDQTNVVSGSAYS